MKRNFRTDVGAASLGKLITIISKLIGDWIWGHVHLGRIHRFLQNEDPDRLTADWKKKLRTESFWDQVEEKCREKKVFWFNEPDWPFQIAIVKIVNANWNKVLRDYYGSLSTLPVDFFTHCIKYTKTKEGSKVRLIRFRPSLIGLKSKEHLPSNVLSDNYESNNLYHCRPEIALSVFAGCREHEIDEETYLVMKPVIHLALEKTITFGAYAAGGISLNVEDVNQIHHVGDRDNHKAYWICEYRLPDE